MKANLITKQITLDYTGVAEPLKIEDVAADISEVNAYRYESPELIVLWEHQWDWLTKDVDNRGSYLFGRAPDERIGYKAIYGVTVRFANL